MKYGYARVSTNGQARDGNSLSAQRDALTAAGAETIYTDRYTGTKADRPKFTKLLSVLGDGDTLIVTKLDRFARSTIDGCTIIRDLLDRGVTVNVLNMGMIENSPVGRLVVTMMFAVAEFERDMIVERTQEGKAIARRKPDYREGRPRAKVDDEEFRELCCLVDAGRIKVSDAAGRIGVSRTTWYRLRKAG